MFTKIRGKKLQKDNHRAEVKHEKPATPISFNVKPAKLSFHQSWDASLYVAGG